MIRLARVESVPASTVDSADEGSLARLVEGAVAEDADLEFKDELYGSGDADKRSLAGDVSALANTAGGLLIIGVREENGIAAELSPVDLSEAEILRMRQVLASAVAPHLAVEIRQVPADATPGRGYYLIAVARSPDSPHAVRVN